MRWAFISALLAGTAPGIGYASPAAERGIVESVREVQLAEPPVFLSDVFELAFRQSTADEVLVRLDDGQVIRVVHTGMKTFEPGQCVQVVADPQGTRVERADDLDFFNRNTP